MKFGKRIRRTIELCLPEWRSQFISYKELKKSIKKLQSPEIAAFHGADQPESSHVEGPMTEEEVEFVSMLYEETEKFNNFFIDKEEGFVITFQTLKEKQSKMIATAARGGNVAKEDVIALKKAFVLFHGEMVLLENYSLLNYIGVRKILKKHDKHSGLVLRSPCLANVLKQPFCTTELLSQLMREAEEKFQLFQDLPGGEHAREGSKIVGLISLPPKAGPPPPVDPLRDPTGGMIVDEGSIQTSILAALRIMQELRPRATSSKSGSGNHGGEPCEGGAHACGDRREASGALSSSDAGEEATSVCGGREGGQRGGHACVETGPLPVECAGESAVGCGAGLEGSVIAGRDGVVAAGLAQEESGEVQPGLQEDRPLGGEGGQCQPEGRGLKRKLWGCEACCEGQS
eukprot:jgi/Mesvir1/28137/Mv04707-RA.1